MKPERLRIQPVPRRLSTCRVCGHITDCVAYDHDLRGDICEQCELPVAIAEKNLRDAQLAVPTRSLLDDGAPESGCL